MRNLILLLAVVVPSLAQAKGWRGVTPGNTPLADVVKRFGEPTKQLEQGKKQVLAYEGDETIEGTKQAQFIVGENGKVEQIAIFPSALVERSAAEETYGPDCSVKPGANCYVKKVSDDDFKTYLWYEKLGLVIFLSSDGKAVTSLLYVKPGAPKQPAKSDKPAPQPAKSDAK